MSSRSQTKSLDRDISRRKPLRTNCPQNVQKVNNTAERKICHYHNQIEDIYSRFTVKRFSDELAPENLKNVIGNLEKKFNLENEELSSISSEMKVLYSEDDLSFQYVEFVISSLTLLDGITSRLSQTILRGLIRYCVSLASYCKSEIGFVVNYEKIIQKNGPDIIREVKDIDTQYADLTKVTRTSRSVLYHSPSVVECINKIRASINKLYYLVTEWVDEERCYPANLSEEIKHIKSQIFALQQRTDTNRDSIVRRQSKLTNLEKQIKVLEKNHNILRRKHRRLVHSQQQIETKIKQVEDQATFREGELTAVNRKLEHLKEKSSKNEHKTLYKVNMEIHATMSEKRDLRSIQCRIDDNRLALDRHQQRLYKIDREMSEKIESTEREISVNKSVKNKLVNGLKDDVEIQNMDLENLKKLYPIMDDLNFLYSKKNSQETLRQLRYHGRLIMESKELHFIDKMCQRVANTIPESWRELYLNLPFNPDRSSEQRSSDIEVIDLVSARNDSTPVKQAIMSLNKWRLFYHNATTEHLIEGLKKSHLSDIAKEIEELDAKSKHRYDDED